MIYRWKNTWGKQGKLQWFQAPRGFETIVIEWRSMLDASTRRLRADIVHVLWNTSQLSRQGRGFTWIQRRVGSWRSTRIHDRNQVAPASH